MGRRRKSSGADDLWIRSETQAAKLVTSSCGAGLVGINLDGLKGLSLSPLVGQDDGQLLGIGGQSGDDAGNALITTGEADLGNGLIGISLGGC